MAISQYRGKERALRGFGSMWVFYSPNRDNDVRRSFRVPNFGEIHTSPALGR